MELVLNLIWLAVVLLISIGAWRFRVRRPEPALVWTTVTITVCVAMLLFPAISLSDDLHMECVAAEGAGKRLYLLLTFATDGGMTPSLIASLVLAAVFAALARKSESGIAEQSTRHPLDGFLRTLCGRAPPAVAL